MDEKNWSEFWTVFHELWGKYHDNIPYDHGIKERFYILQKTCYELEKEGKDVKRDDPDCPRSDY